MATFKKPRIYSHYDIFINGTNSGFATVVYHYGLNSAYYDSFVSAEVFINRHAKEIEGIVFSEEWQTYSEENTTTQNDSQAKKIITTLLHKIITNYNDFKIELKPRRHAFNVLIDSNGIKFKLVLIHEFLSTPNFKQAIILPDNRYIQYPIDTDDQKIIADVYNELTKE